MRMPLLEYLHLSGPSFPANNYSGELKGILKDIKSLSVTGFVNMNDPTGM